MYKDINNIYYFRTRNIIYHNVHEQIYRNNYYGNIRFIGGCTSEKEKPETTAPLIGRAEINVPDGRMTPEVLYSMARVSDVKLSPDGTKVLYGVTFISIEQNKGNRELFVVNTDGSNKNRLPTRHTANRMRFGLMAVKRLLFFRAKRVVHRSGLWMPKETTGAG